MRGTKLLGLAVVATLALTAWIAAPSASADYLCKQKPVGEGSCTEHYGVGTLLSGTSERLHLYNSNGLVTECTKGQIGAKLTNEGSSTWGVAPEAEVTEYTFTGCGWVVEAVKRGTMRLPYTEGNGAIEQAGAEIKLSSPIFGTCYYTFSKALTMTVKGGAPAVAEENAILSKVSGGCGSTLEISGSYRFTSPSPLYFAKTQSQTVLCKQSRGVEEPCSAANVLPAGTFLQVNHGIEGPTPSLTLNGGGFTKLTCGRNFLGFQTTASSGHPLPASTGSSIIAESCHFFETTSKCTSAGFNSPPSTIESVNAEKTEVKIGTAAQPLSISFSCTWPGGGVQAECGFQAPGPVTLVIEGGEAKVVSASMTRTYSSGSIFGPVCTQSATLTIEDSFLGAEGWPNVI